WLKASDFSNSVISTERAGYSTRPYVTIIPGVPFQFIELAPVDLTDGIVDGQVAVSAGNLTNSGRTPLHIQLADQFDNFISSSGYPVTFSVFNVVGATGTVRYFDGALYNIITSTVTDANGQVGSSPQFYYFVSTHAADMASVQFATNSVSGFTLPI